MKEAWGCDKKAKMLQPTFSLSLQNGKEIDYWSCPVQFVPKNIWDFVEEYNYISNYNVPMPRYKDLNPKYLTALRIFTNENYEAKSESVKNG